MSKETASTELDDFADDLKEGNVLKWIRNQLNVLGFGILLILFWEAFARLYIQDDRYLPSASATLIDGYIGNYQRVMMHTGATIETILPGIPVAIITGVALGTIFAESFYTRQSFMPILAYAYSIPHAIMAPLFFVWFGLNLTGAVMFVIWMAFFPTFINTLSSVSRRDRDLEKLAQITGATRLQRLYYMRFFNALPDIKSGAKVTVQMSIVAVVVAEFLASFGSAGGLGQILAINYRTDTDMAFAAVVILAILAIIFYGVVVWIFNQIDPTTRTVKAPGAAAVSVAILFVYVYFTIYQEGILPITAGIIFIIVGGWAYFIWTQYLRN